MLVKTLKKCKVLLFFKIEFVSADKSWTHITVNVLKNKKLKSFLLYEKMVHRLLGLVWKILKAIIACVIYENNNKVYKQF